MAKGFKQASGSLNDRTASENIEEKTVKLNQTSISYAAEQVKERPSAANAEPVRNNQSTAPQYTKTAPQPKQKSKKYLIIVIAAVVLVCAAAAGGVISKVSTNGGGIGYIVTSGGTSSSRHKKIAALYSCSGRIVSKETAKKFGSGTMNYNALTEASENYIKTLPDTYKTDTGLMPQQALNLISKAFDASYAGTVVVYSDYIELQAYKENLEKGDLAYFKVSYYPNGFDKYTGTACYLVTGSTKKSFKDTTSTSKILDKNYNTIGGAN